MLIIPSVCPRDWLTETENSWRESGEKIFRLCRARSLLTDMNEQGGDLSLRARLCWDFVNIYQDYSLSLSLSLFSLLARFWDRTAWGLNIPINSNVTRMKCQHQHTCTSHTGITSGNFVRKLSSSRNILFNKWLTTPSEYSSYQAGPFSPPSSQLKSKGSQEFEALKVSTFFLMQF